MNFERMRDVIDHARLFHTQLSAHFKALNDQEQQERVHMLLEYLSRHEAHMAKVLERYQEDASPSVLETYFQYTAPLNAEGEQLRNQPNLSIEEVIDRATRFDECLVDLYETLAHEAEIPEVREVCDKLVQLEQEERQSRSRSIAGLQQDM
ncbi:hypothetical protein [Motiliproteus sp. SC1-56]|uniref:hypothetical protein n=1 Tax=Motiliproteus sp. SC1-56 TaxID=2799565 RepID=UPI001A8D18B1|nr:hypothetical protein [Motiliproteus sp. SC1-56]